MVCVKKRKDEHQKAGIEEGNINLLFVSINCKIINIPKPTYS